MKQYKCLLCTTCSMAFHCLMLCMLALSERDSLSPQPIIRRFKQRKCVVVPRPLPHPFSDSQPSTSSAATAGGGGSELSDSLLSKVCFFGLCDTFNHNSQCLLLPNLFIPLSDFPLIAATDNRNC